MGFWDEEDGKGGTFDTGGGEFELIPAGTTALAVIESAENKEYQGDEYINLQWSIVKPEEYKNRRVFQKIRIYDENREKAKKAKAMLAAIDYNAGGKLVASGEAPTDELLTKALVAKQMLIKIQIWKMDDRKGNFVVKVAPKGEFTNNPTEKKPAELDDEIPFD